MTTRALCKHLPSPIDSTDINDLKNQVERALLYQARALSTIRWEDWLEVIVEGKHQVGDLLAGELKTPGGQTVQAMGSLDVHITRLKRGIHPVDGSEVTLNRNGVVVPFPRSRRLDEGDVAYQSGTFQGQPFMQTDTAKERSYLPATPENVAALQALLERLQALNASMANFLSQANLPASVEKLLRSQGGLVLPAPEATPQPDPDAIDNDHGGERARPRP